jgi:hypothetical protein
LVTVGSEREMTRIAMGRKELVGRKNWFLAIDIDNNG